MCHSEYRHLLYKNEDFIKLDADAVVGIKSWRFTKGGTVARAIARGGHGGSLGYSFSSQPRALPQLEPPALLLSNPASESIRVCVLLAADVCFCEGQPCKHAEFTGTPTAHVVLPSTQEKADRELATEVAQPLELTRPTDCCGDALRSLLTASSPL